MPHFKKLRNFDKFPPFAFYSNPSTIRHERVMDHGKLRSVARTPANTQDGEFCNNSY